MSEPFYERTPRYLAADGKALYNAASGKAAWNCRCADCEHLTTPIKVTLAVADIVWRAGCWQHPTSGYWYKWNPAPTWTGGSWLLWQQASDHCLYYSAPPEEPDGTLERYGTQADCLAGTNRLGTVTQLNASGTVHVSSRYGAVLITGSYQDDGPDPPDPTFFIVGEFVFSEATAPPLDCSESPWGGPNDNDSSAAMMFYDGDCTVTVEEVWE